MIVWALIAARLAAGAGLTGVVVDAAGAPVSGAFVVAYDRTFSFSFDQTGVDGAYAIDGLAAGPYRLRVLPPMVVDATEVWLGGVVGACETAPRVLAQDERAVVDWELQPGARLSGRVVDADGVPVVGARVSARTLRPAAVAQTRLSYTDSAGDFEIVGIPADDGDVGTFAVEVRADGVPTQMAPGVYATAAAIPHTLTPGQGLDIGTFTLLRGVSVSGLVVGPDGPVASGRVYARGPSQTVRAAVAGGRYEVTGLPPGEILLWASGEGLGTGYWPGVAVPGDRVALLSEGDAARDVNLVLPAGATLSGTLVDATPGVSRVTVFDVDQTFGVGAEVLEDGSWTVPDLFPGPYVITVSGDDDLVDDLVRDDDGAPVVLDAISGADVNVGALEPPLEARVVGDVADPYTGAPIYGMTVIAVSEDTGRRRTASTDATGHFALGGLAAGRWALSARVQLTCAGDPTWVPVYYPDRVNPALGGVVALAAGDELVWSPVVAPDVDGDGMDDVWEAANGLDVAVDDGDLDLDMDGFTNWDEFVLGTDPSVGVVPEGGCGGCGSAPGGGGALGGLVLVAVAARRGRRGATEEPCGG